MAEYRNELEQFVFEFCYQPIMDEACSILAVRPTCLDLTFSCVKYPETALLQSMIPEFAKNITVNEDTLSFDLVASCILLLSENTYGGVSECELTQWLKISCVAVVTDKLDSVTVTGISSYSRERTAGSDGIRVSGSMIPVIRKDELDDVASAFLSKYCPEALAVPVPVPIARIAEEDLHLTLIHGKCITQDFSVFGEICFSGGMVDVYDMDRKNFETVEVRRGTIIIDAYTFWERNIGCVNNTIAHEVFHWYAHRLYAAIKKLLRKEPVIACRCPSEIVYPGDGELWTDEQRMEWQANKIAPRILMPCETFQMKVEELYRKYGYRENAENTEILECVIDELALFYQVSKQSAKIRMIDTGYAEAATVYNYNQEAVPCFSAISAYEAFYEYSDNAAFRDIIDSGWFIYADGYFVINDPQYIQQFQNGRITLTDYAWHHLSECTLQFSYRKVNLGLHGEYHQDVFHRKSGNSYYKLPTFEPDRNISVVKHAEELRQKKAEFEAQYADHAAVTETFWQAAYSIMQKKKWNTSIFCEKTGLNEMTYSRAKNNADSLPDFMTVISICAGLDLDIGVTSNLLGLAGHTFSSSRDHQAYSFVINNYRGRSLADKNEFLDSINVTRLGSKQRK